MRRPGITASVLAMIAASVVASASALAGLGQNPADHGSLLNEPIEDYRYDGATHCSKQVPSGMKELAAWIGRHTSGESWGITRCEELSPGNFSLHAEGRAIDWHMDSRDRGKKREAMKLIRKRLLAADRHRSENALARRMGIQGIIYDCKAWFSSPGGLGQYPYCYKDNGKRKKHLDPTAAHMDHIHIELNWPGARERTSFWRS